jgi:hypothetical protein
MARYGKDVRIQMNYPVPPLPVAVEFYRFGPFYSINWKFQANPTRMGG